MTFAIRIPDEIAELDDDTLQSELEALVAHEEAETLTQEQRMYLNNIRDELYKRASVNGPYGDYSGPSTDDG